MFKYPAFFIIFATAFLVFLLFLINQFAFVYKTPPSNVKFGISFSPNLVIYLGLDWQKTYLSLLDEQHVKYLRIPSYWDTIQADKNKFDFSQTDFMVDEANKRGVKVLFVVGMKQPRWPECHVPDWAKNLSVEARQQAILSFVQETVKHYLYSSSVWGWQVENEPLFGFGENCDKPDANFLKKEIQAVKFIDPIRPVILTDTGEWRLWTDTMQMSDILGISIYNKAYHHIFGYITYPFPGFTYNFKSKLVRNLFASNNKKTIITELQAEPWTQGGFLDMSVSNQVKLFSSDDFKNNVKLSESTGFDEIYLWGAEWWYFMKDKDHPEYWNFAKTLF